MSVYFSITYSSLICLKINREESKSENERSIGRSSLLIDQSVKQRERSPPLVSSSVSIMALAYLTNQIKRSLLLLFKNSIEFFTLKFQEPGVIFLFKKLQVVSLLIQLNSDDYSP
jgi:hypothetical protein